MNRKRLLFGLVAIMAAYGAWTQVHGVMPKHSTTDPAAQGSTATAPSSSQDAPELSAPPPSELVMANMPDRNIANNGQGIAVVTNADSMLVMANKQRNLPSDYEPSDLVVPNVAFSFSGDSPKKQLRKEAAEALESLFAAAEQANIDLKAVSGYRSYATQKSLFAYYVSQHGEEEAARFSAHAGQSEHQTGLAMDVSSASVGYGLEESYGETKEGRWLVEHAAEYGFIIRYPEGKEKVTGYSYEPWHVRYVGQEVAVQVMDKGITLEEFFDAVAVSADRFAESTDK
ncbi:M15 family metallopeptidase [Cohnella panacarvi]|uniref:M15 family metallopeptidase n=1 Tax=Cohnella panacarvi TaxID=400776 RepID=UPI00047EBAF4|nr:M15 family metallopeptidase [Cohnella panacarvi]